MSPRVFAAGALQAGVGTLVTVLGVAFQNAVPFKQQEEAADPGSVDRKLRVTFFGGGAIACSIAVLTVLGSRLSPTGHIVAAGSVAAGLAGLVLWTALSSGRILVLGESSRRPLLWSSSEEGRIEEEWEGLGGTSVGTGGTLQMRNAGEVSGACEQPAPVVNLYEEEVPAEERCPDVEKVEREMLEAEPEMSLLDAWATAEYWLLYVVVTVGSGTGLMIVNNLGQVRWPVCHVGHAISVLFPAIAAVKGTTHSPFIATGPLIAAKLQKTKTPT